MKQKVQDTVVMVFTRHPVEEAGIKSLVKNRQKSANQIVCTTMLDHTLKVARDSGLPWFVISSSDQKGNNFGEKFSRAWKNKEFPPGFLARIMHLFGRQYFFPILPVIRSGDQVYFHFNNNRAPPIQA